MKPYYQDKWVTIYHGDCREILPSLSINVYGGFKVDLVITSPPYDKLRDYGNQSFDFKSIADNLFPIIRDGGVLVWIVGDAVIDGSETGTSFRQALYFKDLGLKLHDTMIYEQLNGMPLNHNRYEQMSEFMFVFVKGKLRTWNPLLDKCVLAGKKNTGGAIKAASRNEQQANYGGWGYGKLIKSYKTRSNVWKYFTGKGHTTLDDYAFQHPAMFPEQLVADHILSWTIEGDFVLDPMLGSGTTVKVAKKLNRRCIGIEIEEKYCEIAAKRCCQEVMELTK